MYTPTQLVELIRNAHDDSPSVLFGFCHDSRHKQLERYPPIILGDSLQLYCFSSQGLLGTQYKEFGFHIYGPGEKCSMVTQVLNELMETDVFTRASIDGDEIIPLLSMLRAYIACLKSPML